MAIINANYSSTIPANFSKYHRFEYDLNVFLSTNKFNNQVVSSLKDNNTQFSKDKQQRLFADESWFRPMKYLRSETRKQENVLQIRHHALSMVCWSDWSYSSSWLFKVLFHHRRETYAGRVYPREVAGLVRKSLGCLVSVIICHPMPPLYAIRWYRKMRKTSDYLISKRRRAMACKKNWRHGPSLTKYSDRTGLQRFARSHVCTLHCAGKGAMNLPGDAYLPAGRLSHASKYCERKGKTNDLPMIQQNFLLILLDAIFELNEPVNTTQCPCIVVVEVARNKKRCYDT